MLKILIVDDDAPKVKRIIEVLTGAPEINKNLIDIAYNARDAKIKLTSKEYDLLILDVALPEWADSSPAPEGGLALLKEVSERPQYKKPKHIVGLTAYPEALIQAVPGFQQELWHVISYETTSTRWIEQLHRKIKYLLLLANNKNAAEYRYDLCVITALPVPENRAVLDLPWNWRLTDLPQEVVTFHEGTFENAGIVRKVVAGAAPRMGMTAAAILATKAIYNFRPQYLAMVGITAGIPGQCNIGDVILADPTWDYGSGKSYAKDSQTVFEISPHQIPLNPILRNRFELLSQDSAVFDQIRSEWRGPKPDTVLKLVIGPMASGAAVRADMKAAQEIKFQHRKTAAIEMEAYGVMAAAYEGPLPEVKAFVAKGVCDFADGQKSDDFQAYAAYTSASMLKILAEKYLSFGTLG